MIRILMARRNKEDQKFFLQNSLVFVVLMKGFINHPDPHQGPSQEEIVCMASNESFMRVAGVLAVFCKSQYIFLAVHRQLYR